jgi:hypothetical protein
VYAVWKGISAVRTLMVGIIYIEDLDLYLISIGLPKHYHNAVVSLFELKV